MRSATHDERALFVLHKAQDPIDNACLGHFRGRYMQKNKGGAQKIEVDYFMHGNGRLTAPSSNGICVSLERLLKNRFKDAITMRQFCEKHPEAEIDEKAGAYGFIIEKEDFLFAAKLQPVSKETNLFFYVYDKKKLNQCDA